MEKQSPKPGKQQPDPINDAEAAQRKADNTLMSKFYMDLVLKKPSLLVQIQTDFEAYAYHKMKADAYAASHNRLVDELAGILKKRTDTDAQIPCLDEISQTESPPKRQRREE